MLYSLTEKVWTHAYIVWLTLRTVPHWCAASPRTPCSLELFPPLDVTFRAVKNLLFVPTPL